MFGDTARAGNRRFRLLSTLRAHTKAPYSTDFHRKVLMALNRPGTARTVCELLAHLLLPLHIDRARALRQHERCSLVPFNQLVVAKMAQLGERIFMQLE